MPTFIYIVISICVTALVLAVIRVLHDSVVLQILKDQEASYEQMQEDNRALLREMLEGLERTLLTLSSKELAVAMANENKIKELTRQIESLKDIINSLS